MAFSIPMFHPTWIFPPSSPHLVLTEVHLWALELPSPLSQIQQFWTTLASDEQARAEKFRFERDRHRFIASRGTLRSILSRYLDIPPEQVNFSYQPHGKPELASCHHSSLCFNVSHSHEVALYIVADQYAVGVDVEYQRSIEVEGLAKRFFSPYEYALLRSLSIDQQSQEFFHLWTCKEAYLKATGDGLGALSQVEVYQSPSGHITLRNPQTAHPLSHWTVQSFIPYQNYIAAFVIAGSVEQISCFQAITLRGN